eukprot:7377786-Prymnesium_polylepis.1
MRLEGVVPLEAAAEPSAEQLRRFRSVVPWGLFDGARSTAHQKLIEEAVAQDRRTKPDIVRLVSHDLRAGAPVTHADAARQEDLGIGQDSGRHVRRPAVAVGIDCAWLD